MCFLQSFEPRGIQFPVLRPVDEVMAEPLEMVAEDLWRMSDLEGMEQGQGSPWEIRAINMTSCLRKSAQEYTKENVRIYYIIIF